MILLLLVGFGGGLSYASTLIKMDTLTNNKFS
ncbi:Uncharacterised protein [Staphylococcus gallinarum]|uniref:Uncharacterized protein n=1 Tax=Staphylococcus gallinarum TaxID=1293 RepID=A0A380FIZ5_STAGA|nr:Uncharacterised protein [Staphylococcus gallinarum]